MDQKVARAIKEIVDRQRSVMLKEREEIDITLSRGETKRAELESFTGAEMEATSDPLKLRQLDEVVSSISNDRWRREWISRQIDHLDRLEEEIINAAQEKLKESLTLDLQKIREIRQKIEDDEIPRLEQEMERFRRELSKLEARAVEISDQLSNIRRGSGTGSEKS